MSYTIFCVDDDNAIRDIEVYTLNSTGFNARGFESGNALLSYLGEIDDNQLPDLILLDIMMPDKDGIEVLKILRNNSVTINIPVIMATAKGMEYDKIQCLDLGADDYLVKPFGVMEMVARVKAVLRRSKRSPSSENVKLSKSPILTCGEISMDTEAHIVKVSGEKRDLTFKEFLLLKLFLENQGRIFTRDQILNAVWDTDYLGETRTVDMHVKTLRHKLEPFGKLIETVINVGYGIK